MPKGGPSEIGLEVAGNPPIAWRGGFLEPTGGYRIALRIYPGGQIELAEQISVWQKLLK